MKTLSATTGVLVLGMHRSGTSALSGLLAKAGFNMGSDLFGPQEGVNEQGFFENSGAVAINERLLDHLGAQWDQPYPLQLPEVIPERDKIADMLEGFLLKEYSASSLWGMKDPRAVLLEPLWRAAIQRCDGVIKYIIICRHPLEVADSLGRRDRFSVEKSLALWLNYNFCALDAATETESVFVSFASLMSEPDETLATVGNALGLSKLKDFKTDGFIEKKLYRSKKSDPGDTPLAALAEALYAELQSGTPNDAVVTTLREAYAEYQHSMDPALTSHLSRITRSEIHFRHLFYEAYNSWWWKAATPLRWLERTLRKPTFKKAPPRY